jgi:uncharacterized protein (UPF0276 family)
MVNNPPKLATPISHLFGSLEQAEKIMNASDCLECRDHAVKDNYDKQEVFHCDLQPIQNLGKVEFTYLEQIKLNKKGLKLISFHLASCYDAPLIKDGKFLPGGNKLTRANLISNASKNLTRIKDIFGPDIDIAVENNNHYKTEAYDYVTTPEFISEVVVSNDITFLFDIAHARVSAVNQEVSFENYIGRLPLDRLIQIHISRAGYNINGEIVDKHDRPGEEEIEEVINLLELYPEVKYLTVEYYRNADELVHLLNKLKMRING